MKHTLLTSMVVSFAAVSALSQPGPDLRVLSEDSRSVVLELTPVVTRVNVAGAGDAEYTRFDFLHAIVQREEWGTPILPFRAALIHLPAREYRLQLLEADFEEVTGIRPAVHPKLVRDRAFGIVAEHSPPLDARPSMDFLPAQIAHLTDVGESRGLLLGTLRVYPVQISAGRGAARVYTRIVVRIDFSGEGLAQESSSLFLKGDFPVLPTRAVPGSTGRTTGDSPLAQGVWYKIEVKESGIYKIDQDFLTKSGISLSSIGDINSIRIFGNGGVELPENLLAPRPDGIAEIARQVVDRNGNGAFDPDDFILFYGKSTRGWRYNPAAKAFNHYINNYTETNHYFFTFGGTQRGKDMELLPSASVAGPYRPADFQGKAFVEEELNNLVNSGRQWIGQSFDMSKNVFVFTTPLPGIDATKPVTYRFVFLSRSTSVDTFRVQENNQPFGTPILTYPINVAAIDNEKAYQTPVITFQRTGAYPDDRSVLRIEFGTRNAAAQGWIDWFEIFYRQRFEAVNDALFFTSPDTTATVEYLLSKFSSRDIHAFDVTDHSAVKRITEIVFDPANSSICRFQVAQTAGSVREFAVVGPTGVKSPAPAARIGNSNVRGITDGADFIIISPPEFLAEAERLREHRQRNDGLVTVVVNVNHIFNEFSVGMVDPIAIRDFLKHARATWVRKPAYVLLFGSANFDYKNIKYTARNWIPAYESVNSIHQIFTLASDDYYVFLDPGAQRISMAIGRLPVASTTQAREVVDKIIAYDTSAPLDPWRNRVTYVADDGLTSTGDDGATHTAQADELARLYTPASVRKQKIYIVEFPTVSGSTGRRKPAANRAILEAINRGTLLLNYTGHGNTEQWAHENVFSKDESFPKINNGPMQFFLVAATCDFARYDYPAETSAGEELLLMAGRGAIGILTANRVVYSGDNAYLNNVFYTYLFQRDAQGRPARLGDAMWGTKQLLNSINDQKHHLLADPTMRLAMPLATAVVDSINGRGAERLISVPALAKVSVRGGIQNPAGGLWDGFNGRALLEVFDSKKKRVIPEWGTFSYELDGSLIYRGDVSVTNGAFGAVFPIPKDVSYDDNRSRISLYAWGDVLDASGFTENITIAGTALVEPDTVGPQIDIWLDDPSFRSGDIVKPDALLIVDLRDENGINTSTAGIGHRLEASLNDGARTFDLTEYYRGNLDTYQSGQVRYPLRDLPEGRHTLSVTAWDIHNNSSVATTSFEVRSGTELAIYNVFNVPNPFGRTTTFTFQRTSFEPVDVEVKIYTLAGRLIQTLSAPSMADRFVQVPWDGRDRDGNELANGVYFYKVIVKSRDRESAHEVLGKLTVLR